MFFPYGLAGKESACNAEDLRLIPGLGRSPGEGKGYPLQYSGLENSMDWFVHRSSLVAESGGYSLVTMLWLLVVVAFPVVEHSL